MTKPQIIKCTSREILDSRGNPTLEATVVLSDGSVGVASVPSGASTGIYEAVELRDGDIKRYNGKGVLGAVSNVCRIISPAVVGLYAAEQYELDRVLRELDGTDNKSKLGANAILAVSLANARACANSYNMPLYKFIGGMEARNLPIPMMNILNGGAHANNNIEIQEFMIVPTTAPSFSDAVRMGAEIYHRLGRMLADRGYSTAVGDEGGYAPSFESDMQALDFICEAIEDCGYSDCVKLALDAAASEWYCESEGIYKLSKRGETYDADGLIDMWEGLCHAYPIISLEDGLDQRDFASWARLTQRLGDRCMLVGDDLFVTNINRFKRGVAEGAANAVLIKPNQIGTLSEVAEVIGAADARDYISIMSHRSGETEDTTIADLAVGLGTRFIKSGAPCRGERVAKYNRLIRIEASLGRSASYGFNFGKIKPTATTFCGEVTE